MNHQIRNILRIFIGSLVIFLWFILVSTGTAQSEEPEYRLNVKRNFGFSSQSQIKGNFTNSIVGPTENIRSVTFYIDGVEMATVDTAPFSFRYETTNYPLGWHDLRATVTTLDGRLVETPVRRFQFVTTEEEFAAIRNIIFPLLGGIIALMVLIMGSQMLLMRQRTTIIEPGTPRQYGFRGGTICSRCQRPFSIHLWALNFGPWKFDRCDFCGKWAFVTRLSPEILRAAERAEVSVGAGSSPAVQNQEEVLKRMLDDSRYTDKQ